MKKNIYQYRTILRLPSVASTQPPRNNARWSVPAPFLPCRQLSSLYLLLVFFLHLVDGCTWHRGWRREHGMQDSAVRISMRRLYEYNSRPIYSSDTCGFEPEPADYS